MVATKLMTVEELEALPPDRRKRELLYGEPVFPGCLLAPQGLDDAGAGGAEGGEQAGQEADGEGGDDAS